MGLGRRLRRKWEERRRNQDTVLPPGVTNSGKKSMDVDSFSDEEKVRLTELLSSAKKLVSNPAVSTSLDSTPHQTKQRKMSAKPVFESAKYRYELESDDESKVRLDEFVAGAKRFLNHPAISVSKDDAEEETPPVLEKPVEQDAVPGTTKRDAVGEASVSIIFYVFTAILQQIWQYFIHSKLLHVIVALACLAVASTVFSVAHVYFHPLITEQ